MEIHLWNTYLFASILIAISPGSGAILSMSHGIRFGVRRSSATIFGLECGLLVVLLIAGAGVGSLLVASKVAFNLVKILGSAYLIYIGFSQWRGAVSAIRTSPALPLEDTPTAIITWQRRYVTGLLTNLTNPKGIVFMVAVLPQFITPDRTLATQLMVMSITTLSVDVVVMHGYAFAGRSLQNIFRSAQALKNQNRIFGGLLMIIGMALLFVKPGSHN